MTEMSPIANNDAVSKETTDYTKPKKSDKICDLREFCKINPILLTSKLFYFFFFGGIGALFPYLTIYFKQLGLGPLRIGLLSGVRPFIGFLSGPLWGAVADRYRKRKIMLMISLCGWIGMLLALGFVPPAKEGECPVAANIVEQFLNGTNATTATENSTTEVSRRSLKSRSFSDLVHVSCGNCQLTNHDGRSRDLYSGRSHVVLRSAKPEFSEEVVAAIDTMNDGEDRSWLYDDDSLQKLFLILMALIMIGEFMQSPASALADTATLKNLGEKNLDKYGHQRVWGAIGLGVASFTVGALLNLTRETFTKCGIELVYSDYHVAFYCFAVLMTGAFIVAATFKFKKYCKYKEQSCRQIRSRKSGDEQVKSKDTYKTEFDRLKKNVNKQAYL
uniref:Major facilitator superfamily domain-containing protein 6-like n=1 Tax=Saccoglossus kowalevskii TaxID=10224 RepID=A0ABM0MEF4_SACKO|nr:PREDICTED: major facilitator superfamily domain-containing protein 6-like [Saccoglossus kowalevskii]